MKIKYTALITAILVAISVIIGNIFELRLYLYIIVVIISPILG